MSQEENSSRESSSRASTSQRLGDEQHQPTEIGPRAKLQHPAAAPLVQDVDTMDVDCHLCASKQEQIVKFACGEQGLGRAGERSKRSSW